MLCTCMQYLHCALLQQLCMQLEGGNMVACDGSDERFHEDCINYRLESGGWVHVQLLSL